MVSLRVGQRVFDTGWEMANRHWPSWFLLVFAFSKSVEAPIRIEVEQAEFHFIPDRDFTLTVNFTLDPPDTIYSGTWRKMNTETEIAECYLKPKDSQKGSTQEQQGTCRLQDSSISFTLRNLIPANAGDYHLELVSEAGEMESALFTAKLYEPVSTPSIDLNTGEINVGTNLTLICKIEKGTDPQFNWQMDSRPLANNTRHSVSENGTILSITAITPSDCGSYKCLVKNEISQQEKHFNLSSKY
ncbi:basement membrane-specific heparan sulfate proteoglycan core protein-like isoform X2 [Cetorhinus maximus]